MFVAKDGADNLPSSKLKSSESWSQEMIHGQTFVWNSCVFSLLFRFRSATFSPIQPFNRTSAFCSRFFSSSSDIELALQETFQRCGECGFGHDNASTSGWTSAQQWRQVYIHVTYQMNMLYIVCYVFLCRGGHGGMTYTVKTKNIYKILMWWCLKDIIKLETFIAKPWNQWNMF